MHHTCRNQDHQTATCGRILQGKQDLFVYHCFSANDFSRVGPFASRLAPTRDHRGTQHSRTQPIPCGCEPAREYDCSGAAKLGFHCWISRSSSSSVVTTFPLVFNSLTITAATINPAPSNAIAGSRSPA